MFGVAGPVQTWWRDQFGADAWFPDIRSMPGAIVTLTLTLYPYVYLLARAALRDQAADAYFVARTLGASPAEATRRVVLPLLRPAIAAGAAVVVMETLTDFATVQYFGVDTVSVGVFRIWRGTYDRDAAAELATLVLVFAVLAIGLERILRGRARYGRAGRPGRRHPTAAPARLAGDGGDGRVRSRGRARLRRPDRAAGGLGDPRADREPGHASRRPVPRLPRQQPRADPDDRGHLPRRRRARHERPALRRRADSWPRPTV